MILDALEMARRSRDATVEGLVCHSDAGSQFTSLRYGERIAEIRSVPSIGSVGDSHDDASVETVHSLSKSELIRQQRRWRSIDDVEFATLFEVSWFNTVRLHGMPDDIPPPRTKPTTNFTERKPTSRMEPKSPNLHQTHSGSSSNSPHPSGTPELHSCDGCRRPPV
jgi:putative transposase